MDLAEYVDDHINALQESGERVPFSKKELAEQIAQSLKDTDYGIEATAEDIEYYL